MRGKRDGEGMDKRSFGITPAHAGKTFRRLCVRPEDRDHPRACGENNTTTNSSYSPSGSPPRMRGKRGEDEQRGCLYGITPAHAGKTALLCDTARRYRDHPRACGENSSSRASGRPEAGSPPRMRGKRGNLVVRVTHQGITPAHAGKTYDISKGSRVNRDHPRACGENPRLLAMHNIGMGSPPRMRGKHVMYLDIRHGLGITPAHAGKTLRKGRISVVDPSPQPRSSLTSRRADASIGSQRAPCAAPV